MSRKGGKRTIRSMTEFEKRYFPKMVERKKTELLKDAHEIGIAWANDTLRVVRKQLMGK